MIKHIIIKIGYEAGYDIQTSPLNPPNSPHHNQRLHNCQSVIDDSSVNREQTRNDAFDLFLKCKDKSSDIFIQSLLDI